MNRIYTLLALLLAALLTACGGGNEDEPTTPTPRVDCTKEPEKCK